MTLRHTATALLFLGPLWAVPATALDLRESAERHAAMYVAQTVAPAAAPLENPNKKTAEILGGVGAALVILGVVYKSGIECKDTSNSFGFECGQTANKTLVLGGLAVAVAGGVMYFVGEGKKKSIGIGISPSGLGVQTRVRF